MNKPSKGLTTEVEVANELGMHARAAARVAEIASKAENTVWIISGDTQVDATSVIDILSLACVKGTKIILASENQANQRILEELKQLVETEFGE